jgi:predicted phage terminase large subunit-like protein
MSFSLTAKQQEAWSLLGSEAKHIMLAGGSRSGKTFITCRAIAMRAMAARRSRHAIFRFRFNAVKASIVMDTFPKMMELCFPSIKYDLNKTDWFAEYPNGSQVWFGGLDDKERTEKILGQEYATMFFNECSQIPLPSINTALTRLAQKCEYELSGETKDLRLKAFYDENPPSQAHWSYKQFVRKIEAESGKILLDPDAYALMYLNPVDNQQNLPADYLRELERMPVRMRERFLFGKFADITAGALWTIESIDNNRILEGLPDMQRVIVGIDPSGSGDTDNAGNDDIGIIVAGLGIDGKGYVLEDCTVKAGPKVWGSVAANAYDRHQADLMVAEQNFGGEMVRFVLKTAKANATVKVVNASRGKVVRAEPISALTENGNIRFAGRFPDLEEELTSMTTNGYMGEKSPNRADAFVWAMSELFPGMVKSRERRKLELSDMVSGSLGYPA